MINLKRKFMIILVFTLFMAILSIIGFVEASSGSRPIPPQPPFFPESDATGYCSSSGGSTQYESITNISSIRVNVYKGDDK